MGALGDAFRTAREAQGLTLSDVAQRIHIRTAYLAAIESEDWNVIGPTVYVKGFLRSYARCLGLDADAAVRELGADVETAPVRNAAPAKPAAPAFTPAQRPEAPAAANRGATARPRRGPSVGALAGLAVALGLVLVAAYEYVDMRLGAPVAASDSATAAPATPVAAAAPTLQPARPTPGLERRVSGFALRLADSSWLRVVVDGKVAMEGIYPKGTERSFAGRSATVRAGNAGGVDVSVDGKDLGPMGGLGDVAERSFQL
jgi:transcriptional regulator with XRE-family HTH domain